MKLRRTTAAVLLAGAMLSALLVAIPPGLAGGSSGQSETLDAAEEYTWSAPDNFTGTLAIGLQLDVDSTAACWVNTTASGIASASNPIGLWVSGAPPGMSGASGVSAAWTGTAQAHAGPEVDSRDIVASESHWIATPYIGWRVDDRWNVTIGAFDLRPWRDDLETAFSVTVVCDEPYTIRKTASRQGHSFSQESFQSGIGATVPAYHPGPPGGKIGVSYDDGFTREFDTQQVRLRLRPSSHSETVGDMTLRHPDGARTWSADGLEFPEVAFQGGPGRYSLEANLVSWSWVPSPYGILVGLDPVESLDEIV